MRTGRLKRNGIRLTGFAVLFAFLIVLVSKAMTTADNTDTNTTDAGGTE